MKTKATYLLGMVLFAAGLPACTHEVQREVTTTTTEETTTVHHPATGTTETTTVRY